jgi:hypothetical protein
VARDGEFVAPAAGRSIARENEIHLAPLYESAFELQLTDGCIPVLEIVPVQILTRLATQSVRRSNGCWEFDATFRQGEQVFRFTVTAAYGRGSPD